MQKDKKSLLYFLIYLSYVPIIIFPILFISRGFFIFPDDTLWLIGTWLGLFAFMFIFWQYFLGIKPIVRLFTDDYVVINKLHQNLGIYGFFLIIAHPIVISISYLTQRGENLLGFSLETTTDLYITLGKLALGLIILNWGVSYLIRSKLSWRWWKRLHLLNYLILPLVYFHSYRIGILLGEPLLEFYLKFLAILSALAFIYRLGKQLGFLKYKYVVKEVKQITHDVVQIVASPQKNAFINPRPGQFLEFQINKFGETHPFTISFYNEENHDISISPKSSGKFSAALTNLKPGDVVYLDGPYGVFTKQAYKDENQNIVLIAGGIGITPFLRFFEHFKNNAFKYDEVVLVYGNKTPDDIAYKEMIDELLKFGNFKVVNILSVDTKGDQSFEKGYITFEIIKKYLDRPHSNYKFFVCGPPIMMDKVIPDLKTNGIESKKIYSEKFSW